MEESKLRAAEETTFGELVGEELSRFLSSAGILIPTRIQAEAIPLLAQGRDIIASSPTGTGKTLAYLLPVFMRLDKNIKRPQALVLTPTHELAAQVYREAERLGKALGAETDAALIIGGANMNRQLDRLKAKPRVIVGSAGRVLELAALKKLTLHFVKTIVLDEGDRLLDARNIESVKRVIDCTLRDRQLAFFSATAGEAAVREAEAIMKEPAELLLSRGALPENIGHIYFVCEKRDKLETLRKFIHAEKITRLLAFVSDDNELDITVKRLNYHGISAAGLYGGARKNERRLALEALREGRVTVLAASDLASRGLDIPGITHVCSLDCPEDPAVYLHRAGRCGRMDAKGTAASIVTEREVPALLRTLRKLGVSARRGSMARGKVSVK